MNTGPVFFRRCGSVAACGVVWLATVVAGAEGPAADGPAVLDVPQIPLSFAEPAEATAPEARPLPAAGFAFDWQAWAVVGVAVVALLGLRLFSRRAVTVVPADVFELLGETTLGNGQPVRIVRFGPKTLLIGSGSSGPITLSELDDPLATEWIAAACRGEQTLRVARGQGDQPAERAASPQPHRPVGEQVLGRSQRLSQPEVA